MARPEAIIPSDLEVALPTGLEQIIPHGISGGDKYYHSGPHQLRVEYLGQRYNSEQSDQSTKADQRRWCNRPAFDLRTFMVAICLAAALGGGLGGGLAAHRKSSRANCTTGSTNNPLTLLPVCTTLAGETSLLEIPTPTAPRKPTTGSASDSLSTLPTSAIATQTAFVACPSPKADGSASDSLSTLPASAIATQTTFVACPSPEADGSLYTATNRPLPFLPGLQISNTSLYFRVNCDTNWIPYSGDSVLQVQGNINSLQECIDACATYTWQAKIQPGLDCSGVVWANGRVGDSNPWQNVCFMKANLTQPCENFTSGSPGYDGAILLYG